MALPPPSKVKTMTASAIRQPLAAGESRVTAAPTYLRVVATDKCNLSCSYCHGEGDNTGGGQLERETLMKCLRIAADKGVRKFKFLGGDPLVRRDLPEVIASLRGVAPRADISLITAGSQKAEKVDAVFGAGLDRINFSMHGFSVGAFAARQPRKINAAKLHAQRGAFVARVLEYGRACKINYVYTGRKDEGDLNQLLDWAAPLNVTVNVLDDLKNESLNADVLYDALKRMRGTPLREEKCPDPDSMETRHLIWGDGLRVELKHNRLGDMFAYAACPDCDKQRQCREGIYAIRLMSSGDLQLCMDRPDIALPLAGIVGEKGEQAGARAWDNFFKEEMNNETHNTCRYRRARRGEDDNRAGDFQIVRLFVPQRVGGSVAA